MWCNFEQSPIEDETISNAFSSRGIFRIQSEEVHEYPQVNAALQNNKVVLSIDKSLILLEDELGAKCSYLSFEAHIDAASISTLGNLILVGLRDGAVHGIFIRGVPLFNVTINAEDVNLMGRTFTNIQQLDGGFHITCSNGSVYMLSQINEGILEANMNISLKGNETVFFDESFLEPVSIKRIVGSLRGLSGIESSVLITKYGLDSTEQPIPLCIAGTHNSVFCREREDDFSKTLIPDKFRGIKRILYLDNYILLLTLSGHLLEFCPITKMLNFPKSQISNELLIDEVIVMECSDENIELLVLLKPTTTGAERLVKFLEYPSFKCNSELEVTEHAWLVHQPKCSVNLYYLSGKQPNESNLPTEIEMILVSETHPSERFKKLISKGLLEEAENFGKQFELCLQPIYEAKAKRVLLTLTSLGDNNPELLEQNFNDLLDILNNIESSEFFKNNRMINMPSRRILERYLLEMLKHLDEEKNETDVLEIHEQLRRLETLTIIDPYEVNIEWSKFIYHANLPKLVIALFKTDMPAACLIWKRHISAMLPHLNDKELCKLLSLIPNHTEPFNVVQWLRQFVPTVSKTHPKLMPYFAEWSIQKTRTLQYAEHWPEIGLEFATKVAEIFEEVQFMHCDVRRQHERNIAKLQDLVNALQDLSVLKKRYNLIFTLDNYLKDSVDETALCILQRVHLDNLRSLVNDFLYPIFQEKGKTPVEAIRQYISLLVVNRNSLSTWLERAVSCIELLHNEDDRLECALMVLQRAPVPWPEITNSLIKLRYSTHPYALQINAEYENQVIKIMKVKYGWPADSNAHINLSLFAQRIIQMQLPDMLDDIRVLIKTAPEVAASANFNCCYQLVRSNKPELAYQYFKSLNDDKNNKACMDVIKDFAALLENCNTPFDDKDIELQKQMVEFFKLIVPHSAMSSVEQQLRAIEQRFVLCHKFRLHVNTVSELVPISYRLQLLDRGIECIMDQSQATVNVPRFIFSEVADLCAALQLEKVYGILHISRRIHCLPLTCALSYAVVQLVDCTHQNKDDFIDLALELLTQQFLVLRSTKTNITNSTLDKDIDTFTFPIAYELMLSASLVDTYKKAELSYLLKCVQLAAKSYPVDALKCFFVDKEREVNEIICKFLDVSEITLADATLNFSAAQINCPPDAKTSAAQLNVSVFDQIDVRPEQPRKKDNSMEQTLIRKFVARSIMLLLAETTPTNSLMLQLRTMLSDDIEKDTAVQDFFISLEKLIKAKMHDIWYIMVLYILEYQKQHNCTIINTDFVSLHLARVFRNVMLNKDVNFIDLFVMLIADKNKESLLNLLSNDLKTDQQRINLLTLSEMYNVHMDENTQVEAIRNKRLKQFYYMEFCKQDPSIKGKFNIETDNVQQLLKLFHNKKLDVKLLERMSRDFNLDYQQLLITQVVSILRGQELKYDVKIDAFGEEELVVSTTVSGISNLCHSYLPAIKNVDMMATRLIQLVKEINIYFYELYLYVIEVLSFFDKMPKEMHIWTSMLHFLKHKMIRRRRNRPGPLETDTWLQSQSEMGVMPKIARFRLPFITIVEQPLKNILDNELSVENCESWFPLLQMHTVLNGSSDLAKVRDYICMTAVKNSIAEYKSKNESETWHLLPTNNAFLQSILRLVKHVTNPSKVFMILYFVSNYAPDGADQVEASYECYKYAMAHEEVLTNKKHDNLIKIKRKYPILKTQHLLYIYGLTDEKLLLLVENPTELIYSLYHHELILKSGKLDINTVAKEIAELHSLDLEAIQFQLLQKWLSFTVHSNYDNLLDETFFDDNNMVHDEDAKSLGNASENVIRANYILNSWPKKQAIEFLVAHIFPADGSVNTSKQLQMYECFSKLNDGSESFKNVLNQKQYITIKCVHELKQLGYNSSLEKFTSCNKIDILKAIWQRNAQNPHTLEILANICLGFDIYHSKIWNGILKRMAMFNMVRELNALVDVVSCEPKLLHTDGLVVAWECVLWHPFKIAHQTRSFAQEEILQKTLFRLQSCPIVHKLNLFEFAELCVNLERPHMAAVAMALCRDVDNREKIKKLILPRKSEKMRKDLLELEDAGLLSVILNFAQKELDM
ncbi:kinetochore-associated protein 1 [Eurosta solidaginis]|uniref:kinetochore-associated protein 1 n=1 Tax=Eurosta solidaginis TaxID=178769 RepID=UPI00353060E4